MAYQLSNLTKRIGHRNILGISDLTVREGGITAVLGPNGAGKTTLLEILAFLQEFSAGEMFFQGEPVHSNTANLTRLRRKVVLVQQHPILFTRTVFQNVEYPLLVRRLPRLERRRLVEEMLAVVDMAAFAPAKAHRLSGGETQRVALAQALACNPEVMLLDEPTANVDREHEKQIEQMIRKINHERGITVIFATHNLLQAARLAEATVCLFGGRLTNASYENIFRIHVLQDGEAEVIWGADEQGRVRLKLPHSQPPGAAYIALAPESVQIHPEPPPGPPGNVLRGPLSRLSLDGRHVRAVVEPGFPVTIRLPEHDFRRMQVRLGDEVWVSIPPSAMEIL